MLLGFVLFTACGGDDGDNPQLDQNSSTGSAVDTRVKPSPNGECVSETDACDVLSKTLLDRLLAVKCVGTSKPCPGLLQSIYAGPNLTYDKGTVDYCVDYFSKETDCSKLHAEQCVLITYPDASACP
ncbi:MAG: hypothetical protein FJ095_11210 [Deltaproteobacteria bacterium]|nr:hypothetical protein [Deltaproteobacteria bacterium]